MILVALGPMEQVEKKDIFTAILFVQKKIPREERGGRDSGERETSGGRERGGSGERERSGGREREGGGSLL